MNEQTIDIIKVLDFIRDHAPKLAKAKATRIYLEEYRKTKKALCMKTAEECGTNAISAQERDAYADPEYQELLSGLRVAVEEEEHLRWMMVAAQAKAEVWRSLQANSRAESKVLG